MITTVIHKFDEYSILVTDIKHNGTQVPTFQKTLPTHVQIFQKPGSHLKILGARKVICSKFQPEDQQLLGITIQNFVATVTWHLEFLHP
jgi:hypothetical protein